MISRRILTVGAVAVLTAGILAFPSASSAEESQEPQPATAVPEINGTPVTEDATFVVTESQIKEAREEAVEAEADHGLSPADQKLEDKLIDATEESGGTLDGDDVDVVPLLDGDVTLTVPVDVQIDKITVEMKDGKVGVSSSSSPTEGPDLETSGPGMASPYWQGDGDGQYVLTVRGLGDGLFLWARNKLINDGSSSYTWYTYRRKGTAQPYERSGKNAMVQSMRIQNFPYDSAEKNLVNWNELDPASDFSGKCGGHVYTAEVSVLGASIGRNFQDCDGYKVWRNANKPSSYWIEMDQGRIVNGGNREIGYTIAWKQKQGTAGSQHDFQRVEFTVPYSEGDTITCSHTDSNDTC